MSVLTAPLSDVHTTSGVKVRPGEPMTARARAPWSISADQFGPALHSGATAVDIRSQSDRDRDGILLGALAIPADDVLARLVPGTAVSLVGAEFDRRWVLVGRDGHDAEMLTWRLQALGVTGARFVVGGQQLLSRSAARGPLGAHTARDLETYAAH
ncbi:rhodanese-like domain-containing protein [Williamsia soli]|uniref:rhodanese-like domain-containing protein n=1 Tax=Williamsia soli TaxID=364929 RepID=UPI001A9FD05E|nr:rhodanese-like domain-containing protein [Williamsia soli]